MATRRLARPAVWCSVLLAVALAGVAGTAWADEFLTRLDRAVVTGSLVNLAQLQAELGEAPGPSDADVYLWSYTSWRLAQRLAASDKKRRKRLLKDVQGHLEGLIQRQPGDAEAFALLGAVLGDRIDGALSGMRLGGRAQGLLDEAAELAANNPRVALQRGVGYYNSPKFAGGGLEKAEAELRRAVELFARESTDKAWPNWGHLDALSQLGQALARLERPEEARASYATALELAPDFVLIRDELLPALDAAGP